MRALVHVERIQGPLWGGEVQPHVIKTCSLEKPYPATYPFVCRFFPLTLTTMAFDHSRLLIVEVTSEQKN